MQNIILRRRRYREHNEGTHARRCLSAPNGGALDIMHGMTYSNDIEKNAASRGLAQGDGEPSARDAGSAGLASASPEDERYMRLAIEQARAAAALGEVPIGAVVVYEPIDRGTRRPTAEPRVIASACNRREIDKDPSGHAEFLAMKKAAEVLDAWRLTDCTVYVTLEPCIMCAGLMHQARVSRCVYGARDRKAGALGTLYAVHADERLNHRFEVVRGVLEEECAGLLKSFFADRRKNKAASKRAEANDSEG